MDYSDELEAREKAERKERITFARAEENSSDEKPKEKEKNKDKEDE